MLEMNETSRKNVKRMSIAIGGIFRKNHNRRPPSIERHQKKTDSLDCNRTPCLSILGGGLHTIGRLIGAHQR